MVKLWPHQEKSLAKILKRRGIVDTSTMGVGKGIVALALVEKLQSPAIAVVPACLTYNWLSEAQKHFPTLKVQRFDAKFTLLPDTNLIVMSYEMMQRAPLSLFKAARVFICDECHFLANPSAKRTKCFIKLVQKYKPTKLLLMSGTLLRNKVPDLYVPLKLLDIVNECGFREAFPTHSSFARYFTHSQLIKRGGFLVTIYEGSRNEEDLKDWLKPQHVCAKLDESKLPPLRHISIKIEKGSAKTENRLRAEWGKFLGDKNMWSEDEDVIGEGEHLSSAKAQNALEKAEKTKDFVRDLLQQDCGPIVVFSDHVAASHHIQQALVHLNYKAEVITGATNTKSRQEIVNRFQAGEIDALVATLGTMSVGVTLTRANICVINDKSWLVSTNAQAMKRIHRIGQTRSCIVYTIVREGVDELIDATLERKDVVEKKVMGDL